MFLIKNVVANLLLAPCFSKASLLRVLGREEEFYSFLLLDGRKAIAFHGAAGPNKPYSPALIASAKEADVIVCCNPVQQEPWMREKHVVPPRVQAQVEPHLGSFGKGLNLVWAKTALEPVDEEDPFAPWGQRPVLRIEYGVFAPTQEGWADLLGSEWETSPYNG